MLKKVTYLGRQDKGSGVNNHNNIKEYLLYYADMQTPESTPTPSDWILVKSGSFTDRAEEQAIVLDQAVKATHFKLVAVTTNNWTGRGSVGDGSTCAKNIKVYAEDTLNLTVTAPVANKTLQPVENETFEAIPATVKDISENPMDISTANNNIRVNEDGTFDGQITNVDDSKLDALTDRTPFMILMKVKLNSAATKKNMLINRGDEPYQIVYDTESGTSKIKFQMYGTDNHWHETKVSVTEAQIGREIEILALYTGSSMGLWVDGGRGNNNDYYKDTVDGASYGINNGRKQGLKIGDTSLQASIKSVQVVKDIGTGLSTDAQYNAQVIPAFNQGTRLLNLRVVEGMADHQYTLTSKWTKDGVDVTEAANTDGTQNYSAVVTATPTGSLKFIDASMPQTLKVKVDKSGTIADVPVTSSSVDDTTGVLTITYDFEELFIGGSLRMDYVGFDQTSMRYGYDFKLPDGAEFVGCVWYYGMSQDALTTPFEPSNKTNHITYQNNGEKVYRSNIVFTGIGKANYDTKVYSRILVKYTVGEKTYSKMGSFIDTRTVKQVAEKINESTSGASKAQKDYAQGILNAIRDN